MEIMIDPLDSLHLPFWPSSNLQRNLTQITPQTNPPYHTFGHNFRCRGRIKANNSDLETSDNGDKDRPLRWVKPPTTSYTTIITKKPGTPNLSKFTLSVVSSLLVVGWRRLDHQSKALTELYRLVVLLRRNINLLSKCSTKSTPRLSTPAPNRPPNFANFNKIEKNELHHRQYQQYHHHHNQWLLRLRLTRHHRRQQ